MSDFTNTEQKNTIDEKIINAINSKEIKIIFELPENLFDKFTSAVDKFDKAIEGLGGGLGSILDSIINPMLSFNTKMIALQKAANFDAPSLDKFGENLNSTAVSEGISRTNLVDNALKGAELKIDTDKLLDFSKVITKTEYITGEKSDDIAKAIAKMFKDGMKIEDIEIQIAEKFNKSKISNQSFLDSLNVTSKTPSSNTLEKTSKQSFPSFNKLFDAAPKTFNLKIETSLDKIHITLEKTFGEIVNILSTLNSWKILALAVIIPAGFSLVKKGLSKLGGTLINVAKKGLGSEKANTSLNKFYKTFSVNPNGSSKNQNPLANSSNKNNLGTLAAMVLKKLNTLFNKLKKISTVIKIPSSVKGFFKDLNEIYAKKFGISTNTPAEKSKTIWKPINEKTSKIFNPLTKPQKKDGFTTLAAVGAIATVGTLGLGGAAIYKNRQKKNHNENSEVGEDILDIDPIANFEDGSEKIGFFSEKLNNLGIDLNSIQTKMSGFGLDFLSLGSIFMSNPIGLAIGAIGGAIYLLIKHFDSVKAALAPFTQFFLDKFSPIINAFQTLWGVGKRLFSLFSSEKQTMSEFGDEAQESAGMFEIAGNIISEIGKIISSAIDLAFLPLEIAINLISAVIETFTRWFNSDISFFDALSSSFKDVFGSFDIFGRIIDHVKLIWSDFYKAILGGINFVGNAVNKVKSWFGFGDKTYEKIDKQLNLATNIGNPYPNFMDSSGTIPDHLNTLSTIGSINQASQIQKSSYENNYSNQVHNDNKHISITFNESNKNSFNEVQKMINADSSYKKYSD